MLGVKPLQEGDLGTPGVSPLFAGGAGRECMALRGGSIYSEGKRTGKHPCVYSSLRQQVRC